MYWRGQENLHTQRRRDGRKEKSGSIKGIKAGVIGVGYRDSKKYTLS